MLGPVFPLLCLGIAAALLLTPSAAGRPRDALRNAWIASAFVLPCWVSLTVYNSLVVDLRAGMALAGMLALAAMPAPSAPMRWTAVDVAFAALLTGMSASELANGSLQVGTLPMILIKYLLPYLVGRRLLGGPGDLRATASSFAVLIPLRSGLGVFEMASKVNWSDKLSGHFSYALEVLGEGTRYGMQRAHGNTVGPIMYGICGLMLLPWALEGSALARAGRGPRWWRWLPAVTAVDVASSLSRGPVMMAGFVAYVYTAMVRPRLRAPMLALGLVGAVGGYFAQEQMVEWLSAAANDVSTSKVVIDGREEIYNGTRHRELLYRAYARPLEDAGPLGVGIEATQLLSTRYRVSRQLASIDNAYILQRLTYGWVGSWLLDLLIAASLWSLARVALRRSGPYANLAAGLLAAQSAVALNLFGVFLSADFRDPWLFGTGLSASLANLDRAARRPAGPRVGSGLPPAPADRGLSRSGPS